MFIKINKVIYDLGDIFIGCWESFLRRFFFLGWWMDSLGFIMVYSLFFNIFFVDCFGGLGWFE